MVRPRVSADTHGMPLPTITSRRYGVSHAYVVPVVRELAPLRPSVGAGPW
jgi:hypothetical protein